MTKEAFVEKTFKAGDQRLIDAVNEVIERFADQGIPRNTLRTVYYGLVAQDLISNNLQMYNKIKKVVSDARLAGEIDWEAIVDLERKVYHPFDVNDPEEFIDRLLPMYRHDRWEGQENYVEVWVEKNGMTVSIKPLTDEWHVPLVANKGYGSMTNLYEGSKRFIDAADDGKTGHILYLGDHDPSGLDMDRDIGARMQMFGAHCEVTRIALTTPQVREYNPPPNPAKFTDSRAKGYIAQFGKVSWEVNALPPSDLNEILGEHIEGLIDKDALEDVKRQEAKEKAWLKKVVAEAIRDRVRDDDNPFKQGKNKDR